MAAQVKGETFDIDHFVNSLLPIGCDVIKECRACDERLGRLEQQRLSVQQGRLRAADFYAGTGQFSRGILEELGPRAKLITAVELNPYAVCLITLLCWVPSMIDRLCCG